ncbi:MAG TPA: ABC transporter permease [Actinophytocola sp.]|uniref:ABC transporter permease n=1 Tax=Actinophytocola sp. TaxID=1872138 RepID=UPI002DBDA643|nr:ABC transporter permease [Actinophytocola sp.]HEU5475880.1 ABC transporter permease [Actinophytocola sp.]
MRGGGNGGKLVGARHVLVRGDRARYSRPLDDRVHGEPARRPRGTWSSRRGFVAPLVFGVVLLSTWQALTGSGVVSTFFLPTPGVVAETLGRGLLQGSVLNYTWITLVESLLGSLLGAVVAIPLGYAIARNALVAAMLQPYLAALQAIPAVALAPLLALWLGYGLTPVVVLCALLVFFPIVVNTTLGLRTLDREVLDAARVDGATRWRLCRHVEAPLALPSVLAGLRTGVTWSVTGAVVGELVVGGSGLGQFLAVQRDYADSAGLFATLVVLAALAAALHGGVRLVEGWVSRRVGE